MVLVVRVAVSKLEPATGKLNSFLEIRFSFLIDEYCNKHGVDVRWLIPQEWSRPTPVIRTNLTLDLIVSKILISQKPDYIVL